MIFTLVLEIVAQKKNILNSLSTQSKKPAPYHTKCPMNAFMVWSTPPSPLQHNASKPEMPIQVELPMVEFLPHMEESIDIANYLGQEQAFSNCNGLSSSMLLEDTELLFNSSCHTLTDLTNANNKMTLTPSIFELQTYGSKIYTALI